jgi:hypothetical protein
MTGFKVSGGEGGREEGGEGRMTGFTGAGGGRAGGLRGVPHWSQCRLPVGILARQLGHVVISGPCGAAVDPAFAAGGSGFPQP